MEMEMEITEENCKPFRNGKNVMKLQIIALQIQLNKQSKQTK